jgi:hypothetical protein
VLEDVIVDIVRWHGRSWVEEIIEEYHGIETCDHPFLGHSIEHASRVYCASGIVESFLAWNDQADHSPVVSYSFSFALPNHIGSQLIHAFSDVY